VRLARARRALCAEAVVMTETTRVKHRQAACRSCFQTCKTLQNVQQLADRNRHSKVDIAVKAFRAEMLSMSTTGFTRQGIITKSSLRGSQQGNESSAQSNDGLYTSLDAIQVYAWEMQPSSRVLFMFWKRQ